ncbi:MAG: DUF3598 family protein [Gloeomargaritaceae cyanobacterium C42_A2020_066]|nr:DUF3598 family protein [Gloeomargaritaceae cyanobacterium C42_A2020_066]
MDYPSQWQNLLQNLGDWQGSFTRLTPQGEVLEVIPSRVVLAGREGNRAVEQTITLSPPGQPPQDRRLFYSTLNRGTLVFANGAFSQGSLQWGPLAEFGAELGLIHANQRVRLVQQYNRTSHLDNLTLIQETQAGRPADPPVTPWAWDSLVGVWDGTATTLYPDWRNPEAVPTCLEVTRQGETLHQTLTAGPWTKTSAGRITGNQVLFTASDPAIQVLDLGQGMTSTCPVAIKGGRPCFLELGWCVNPSHRQRMIRTYDGSGAWVSLTLVEEFRRP